MSVLCVDVGSCIKQQLGEHEIAIDDIEKWGHTLCICSIHVGPLANEEGKCVG